MATYPEFRSPLRNVWQYLNRSINEFRRRIDGYDEYTVLLTQTGTNAPVAKVLRNTLGVSVEFTRVGAGVYTATFDKPMFDSPNEYVVINGGFADTNGANDPVSLNAVPVFFATLAIESYTLGAATDGLIGGANPCVLTIRKYI